MLTISLAAIQNAPEKFAIRTKGLMKGSRCDRVRYVLPQESCRLLTDHHAGRHRVAGRYTRQDGSIGDTETIHTVDLQFAIDHRHCVAAHLRTARLMPEGAQPVAKEPLQLR